MEKKKKNEEWKETSFFSPFSIQSFLLLLLFLLLLSHVAELFEESSLASCLGSSTMVVLTVWRGDVGDIKLYPTHILSRNW